MHQYLKGGRVWKVEKFYNHRRPSIINMGAGRIILCMESVTFRFDQSLMGFFLKIFEMRRNKMLIALCEKKNANLEFKVLL